jgi:hypothetical protein
VNATSCEHCGRPAWPDGPHVAIDDSIACANGRFGRPVTVVLRFDRLPMVGGAGETRDVNDGRSGMCRDS